MTLTRTGTTAPFDVYQTGALTWSDGTHNVRVPIVVKPVQLITATSIVGSGASGTFSFNTFAGYTGPYTVAAHGLVPDTRTAGVVNDDPNDAFDTTQANLTTQAGVSFHDINVPIGQRYVRFALFDDFTDGNDDLDLFVYRQVGHELAAGRQHGRRDVGRNAQHHQSNRRTLPRLRPRVPDRRAGRAVPLFHWIVPEPAAGNLTVTAPATVTAATTTRSAARGQG